MPMSSTGVSFWPSRSRRTEAGEVVSLGDPAGQAARCLENLRTVVSAKGFAIGDVRRLTIYVVGGDRALVDAWQTVVDGFSGAPP